MQGSRSSSEEREKLLSTQEKRKPKCTYQPIPVNIKRIALGAWFLSYMPVINWFPRRSYQVMVFVLTFATYASYHMTRKTFGTAKSVLAPNCSSSHGGNNTEVCGSSGSVNNSGWEPFVGDHCGTLLGIVDDSWSFAYAIAMFGSGFIAERVNLRYFLTFGLIGSAISTGLLGVANFINMHHLYYFIGVQVFSGVMQSTGWPGTVALMGNWFGIKRRGLFMGIWNAHTSVGNILGTVIPSVWSSDDNWAWSFLVPAFMTIAVAVIVFFFLVVDPSDIGQPPPTHHLDRPRSVTPTSTTSINDDKVKEIMSSEEENNELPTPTPPVKRKTSVVKAAGRLFIGNKEEGAVGFLDALMIPGVIEFSLALFFSKLVAYTFLFWLPFYVHNHRIGKDCLTSKQADLLSTLFDFGGIIGGIIAGVLSDILNARAITCTLMLYLSVPALFLYNYLGHYSFAHCIILLLICGLCVNGPYACITTAVSSDLGTHKSLKGNQKAKATVSAIIDGTGSIGAALGPLLTGWISDDYGWTSVFYMLMISCFLSSFLLTRLVFNEIKAMYQRCRKR